MFAIVFDKLANSIIKTSEEVFEDVANSMSTHLMKSVIDNTEENYDILF